MIRGCLLITLVSITISECVLSSNQEWERFKVNYGKVYDSVHEEANRRLIFLENLTKIKAHNERADKGLSSYRMGINKFTDKLPQELKGNRLAHKLKVNLRPKINGTIGLPKSVDWRSTIVTRVKDQGDCLSSWAFSAVAALESASAQRTGQLVEFSEQNLLDCTWNYGNKGCGGGFVYAAFAHTKANNGIDTESCYPYTSSTGNETRTCGFSSSCVGTKLTDFIGIPSGDEETLTFAVSQQVVSVSILGAVLIPYESGIIDVEHCVPGLLGHSVAIVGYGTENGKPFWLVKNSWGTDWGESGYFRLVRGKNMCMVAESAYYPII